MAAHYPFKLGEPVWALMDGFPWWPARVVTRDQIQLDPGEVFPDQQPDELLVEFFNDNNCFATITRSLIRPFKNSRYRTLNRHYNGKFLENVILAVTEADRYLADWLNNGLPKVDAPPYPSPHPSATQSHHNNHSNPSQSPSTTEKHRGVKRRRRGLASSATSSPTPDRKRKPTRLRPSQVPKVELVHVATKHESDSDLQHPSDKPPTSLPHPPVKTPPPSSPSPHVPTHLPNSRRARSRGGSTTAPDRPIQLDSRSVGSTTAERGAPSSGADKIGVNKNAENGSPGLAANGFAAEVGRVIEHVPAEALEPRRVAQGVGRGEDITAVTEVKGRKSKGSVNALLPRLYAGAGGENNLADPAASELEGVVGVKDKVNLGLIRKIEELDATIQQLQNRVRELDQSKMSGHEMISRGIALIQEGQNMLRKGGQGNRGDGKHDSGKR